MHYVWEHAVATPAGTAAGGNMLIEKTTGDLLCNKLSFRPDAIKIDVEGHEVKVLRGLTDILKSCRPSIFIELHPSMIEAEGDTLDEIANLVNDLGFCVKHPMQGMIPLAKLTQFTSIERVIMEPTETSASGA